MNKKYRVEMKDEERKELFEKLDASNTCKTIRKRCNILLLSDEAKGKPMKQEEIAKRCGVSEVTVYQTVKDYQMCGLEYALRGKKHAEPPRKAIVTGEIEARIIAVACSEPPKGYSRWTIRLLREKVIEMEIVPSIGRETVRSTLKKRNLSLT